MIIRNTDFQAVWKEKLDGPTRQRLARLLAGSLVRRVVRPGSDIERVADLMRPLHTNTTAAAVVGATAADSDEATTDLALFASVVHLLQCGVPALARQRSKAEDLVRRSCLC